MSSPGTYLFWISVTHFVPKLGFVMTITAGTILLLLNYFGAQRNFGSYKYLISAFTLLGMTFATVEIFVWPNVHNYKAALLFFSFEESFGLSGSWSRNIPLEKRKFTAGYTFLPFGNLCYQYILFIDTGRFLNFGFQIMTISSTNKLNYFKGFYSLIWVVYCAFFGFQYALGTYFFLARDETSDEYLREEVLHRYNVNISEIPAMSIVAYDPVDGSIRWRGIMGILNICSIISLPSGVMLCSFTLYPATDSIIVMYVVSEYTVTAKRIRRACTNGFHEMKASSKVHTITPMPTSTAPQS
ncbi:hypothetical protein CRE_22183 [Caenorhabditis remanei]|uniref:Uncharacterized protein n=1 Tax=Caenorhabditis remanei TaxID=31234 RepID=E3NN58_CAERE|nr:hypothetical protein CRE_22183 [Caenorhabditis remanei]